MDRQLPTVRHKDKISPAIRALIGVFLVVGIGAAAYFVSNKLATTRGVALNAPASEPQAANGCADCGEQQCCKNNRCSFNCEGVTPTGVPGGCAANCVGAFYCDAGVCRPVPGTCGGKPCSGFCDYTNPDSPECNILTPTPTPRADWCSGGCGTGQCCQCDNRNDAEICTTGSYCGSCDSPNVDLVQCGATKCNNATEHCCPSGCKSKNEACGSGVDTCTDSSWSPDPSNTCSAENVTQTSNCNNTRTVPGTKSCSTAWCTEIAALVKQADGQYNGNFRLTPAQFASLPIGTEVLVAARSSVPGIVAQYRILLDGNIIQPEWRSSEGFVDAEQTISMYRYTLRAHGAYGVNVQIGTDVCSLGGTVVPTGKCESISVYKKVNGAYNYGTPLSTAQIAALSIDDTVLVAARGTASGLSPKFRFKINDAIIQPEWRDPTGYQDAAQAIATFEYTFSDFGKYTVDAKIGTGTCTMQATLTPKVSSCSEVKIFQKKSNGSYDMASPLSAAQFAALSVNDVVLLTAKGSIAGLKARFRITRDDIVLTPEWLMSTGYSDSAKLISTYEYTIANVGKYKIEAQVSSMP